MNLPTEQQCLALFQEYHVPSYILKHCLKVREVALFLARELNTSARKINLELVNRLALLHDLFKMATIKELQPNRPHHFDYQYSPLEIQMWKKLRSQYAGMYETEIASALLKKDYPGLAVSLSKVSNPQTEKNWEELIVHYADWRIMQNQIVDLSQRLDYLKTAYPQKDDAWKKNEDLILNDEARLFSRLSFSPRQLKEKMGH